MVEASLAVRAGLRTRADDHVAHPDPRGNHRQRRQDRERFEGDLVGRFGDRREGVEDPLRLEAEVFGLAGELDRPGPGRTRSPAVVFALPALGNQDTNIHGNLLVRSESYVGWRIRLRDEDSRRTPAS